MTTTVVRAVAGLPGILDNRDGRDPALRSDL
jgi:hypothetical protein